VTAILRDVIAAFPAQTWRTSAPQGGRAAWQRLRLQTIVRELQLLDLLVHLTDFRMCAPPALLRPGAAGLRSYERCCPALATPPDPARVEPGCAVRDRHARSAAAHRHGGATRWGSRLRKHTFRDLRTSAALDHVRVLCQV